MKTSDLIFIGIKGSVVALNRATGGQIWVTNLKGSGFVNVVLQDGAVLAAVDGEIFCLDPQTGAVRWHNPLKGYGVGLACFAAEGNPAGASAAVLAEKRNQDEQQAASAAATTAG